MKKKRVLVTGAGGTVGYEVLKQLVAKDSYDITVFDIETKNSKRKFAPFKSLITIIYGNITNKEAVYKATVYQDVVIHLAAIIPPLADENTVLARKVNVNGTQTLIEALEQNSPEAFLIYSSSISVYGDRVKNPFIRVGDALMPSSGDEYGKTKIEAENFVKNSNLDWSIFRLAAIMGNHKMSKLMFHQPLNTSLEIATPRDTARAFVNAIEKQLQLSKRIFNLGGGENCRTTYQDFLERSFKIYGLGAIDFPKYSFADKNFHCGYYADGDELENMVHFRRDSLEDYFEMEIEKISSIKKAAASILKYPIKWYLTSQSEPLEAFKKGDQAQIQHYFN